jgi:nucleotide-binding universal stress UspA family protein/pimeloyl-ACP methyl ester carboxylesterase
MLPIRTVLHPTDLSENSATVFQFASTLARDYGARLIVMTAYPPPLTGAEAIDRGRPDGIEEDLLAKLRELKPDPVVPVEYRVEEGRPADMILAVADEIHADLIVMGTHGRSGVPRLVMGSVAEGVHRKASCPVMTVRGELTLPAERPPAPAPAEAERAAFAAAVSEGWRDAPGPADPSRELAIPAGGVTVRGELRWSGKPCGVVVFAHGSGSSRHSPRNQLVAQVLNGAGFATLLMDLLTEDEGEDRDKVFDCALLADRLAAAAEWVTCEPEMAGLPIGVFGASTGSAAALMAAASHPRRVSAVVSRGGRPDLARNDLPAVRAPTLLIVGGDDEPVLTWNREALARLTCVKELAVVPGATHLFEEPGALERVAELARDWFARHLTPGRKAAAGAARGYGGRPAIHHYLPG